MKHPDKKPSTMLGGDEPGARVRALEAERRAKLAALEQRHTPLSDTELEELVEVFPVIYDDHCDRIWKVLHKAGAPDDVMGDLIQDCVEKFLVWVRANGMPESLPAKLQSIAAGLTWNHLRGERRDREMFDEPPSSDAMPTSWQALDSKVGARNVARRLFNLLSPEHKLVVDAVILRELSHEAAARELGLPKSTVTDRLEAAEQQLLELAQIIIPLSQRYSR